MDSLKNCKPEEWTPDDLEYIEGEWLSDDQIDWLQEQYIFRHKKRSK